MCDLLQYGGGWAGGIGAFLAVLTSLYLANRLPRAKVIVRRKSEGIGDNSQSYWVAAELEVYNMTPHATWIESVYVATTSRFGIRMSWWKHVPDVQLRVPSNLPGHAVERFKLPAKLDGYQHGNLVRVVLCDDANLLARLAELATKGRKFKIRVDFSNGRSRRVTIGGLGKIHH
jgi:hypothetical protein